MVGHPFALCFQYLFYHISATSHTPGVMTDIEGYLLYFGCCIFGATRTTTTFHNLEVRNIIAHIKYILVLEGIFLEQGGIG